MTADIFYHAAEKPLAPSSVTITVNGSFVCEAFPAQKLPFIDADQGMLQEHLDSQKLQEQELKSAVTRVWRSTSVLPHGTESSSISEKTSLRSECFTVRLDPQTSALSDDTSPAPDSPEFPPETDAGKRPTSSSSVQEVLSFLFGE